MPLNAGAEGFGVAALVGGGFMLCLSTRLGRLLNRQLRGGSTNQKLGAKTGVSNQIMIPECLTRRSLSICCTH